ncbi:hypothetical protein [Anaeromicrobium sediminis]|uniref:Uncharacterized protein n=1 Tax=Anaeromicrobium sediminis TaxID=1478221 RepID=A0A267MKF3_9FIRM|nr:hypothetical protein [Anaeromicrobium sediminis]PAB60081.1 hypothetical protein CCE28_06815 [Anaeromicrobium sediminis]
MDLIKKTAYIALHVIELLVLGFSLIIYTSLNKQLPWYESCGTQFLAIFMLSIPSLIFIGIGFIILNKKYELKKLNIKIPFYSAIGLGLPILIDGGLSKITITIGTFLCVMSILVTIAIMLVHFGIVNLKSVNK